MDDVCPVSHKLHIGPTTYVAGETRHCLYCDQSAPAWAGRHATDFDEDKLNTNPPRHAAV